MSWWLRTRLVWALAGCVLAGQLVCLFAGTTPLPLVNLAAGTVPAPLALLVPASSAILIAVALGRGPSIELVAVRRIRSLDAGLGVAIAGLSLGLAAVSASLGADDLSFCFARNVAGLSGISMVSLSVLDRNSAGVVPVLFLIACALVGVGDGRAVRWWAFALQPSDSLVGAGLAACCLVAGAFSISRSGPAV